MTDASPPLAWLDADAELKDRLDAFDRDTREAVAALREALGAEVAEPLRRLVAETAAAHRREMTTHGFDRALDDPPRPPAVLWDALTAYRAGTTDTYTAFREGLGTLDLGQQIGRLYEDEARAFIEEAEQAPEALVRPEPEGLVEAEAGDSIALIARKLGERTRRRTRAAGRGLANGLGRVVGKTPSALDPHAQAVPLRALLTEQATVRLPRLLLADHERVQMEIGQHVARLEGAFAAWAGELLRLESGLDRPRFHTAEALEWAVDGGQRTEDREQGTEDRKTGEEVMEDGVDGEEVRAAEAEAELTAKVRRVREVVQTLDAALHEAALTLPPVDEAALDAARDRLAERVRRSGFDSDRPARPGDAEPLGELASAVARWSGWHHNIVRRLGVDGLLLKLRGQLVDEVDVLVDRVAEAVVVPVQTTVEQATGELNRLRSEARAACDRCDAPAPLAEALRDLLRRALDHSDRIMLPALQPVSLDRAVEEAVAATRERLAEIVRPLPERVTLHARLGPDHAGRPGAAAEVGLRRIVGSTLSEEFEARLVKSAEPLRQPILRALAEAENVRDIVRFNLETAIEELENAEDETAGDAAEDEPDEDGAHALANARELSVDGLARAEERLVGVATLLAEPWQDFVRRATEIFEGSWTTLHDRSNAETLVAASLLDLKARTRQAAERLREDAVALAGRARTAFEKWFRFGRGKAKRLVEMGQQAAGLAEQSASDRRRTLDALAEAATLHAGLPLVYRRLFSFKPVADPTLFVGRTTELARIADHAERWRAGRDTSTLVVTAEPGGGRTSFLNVIESTVLREDEPARLVLTERIETEEGIASRIGEALGLGAALRTFDMLEAVLLSHAHAEQRHVCLLEGLQHLILRAPDGLELIERTLIFLSRTDTRVLWIGTAVLPGWRFVERTAPQITGLVDTVALPPLSRDEVETALAKRHARSGLPLTFAAPSESAPLLTRRLNKAETPEAKQAVLRGDFFDGLYRASGSNLRLALLYWLRAADFQRGTDEVTADTLTLRPVRPLDFAFVGTFDLSRSFALKALLQHGTLTLAEYDRIFRTSREESFLVFESLYNLRLIQRADSPDGTLSARRNGAAASAMQTVQEGARYRLHPLVVAPVTNALRTKNML
ncbi:MAG: hypothetical protein AAGI91_14500 [Bacteroidota bacterium]